MGTKLVTAYLTNRRWGVFISSPRFEMRTAIGPIKVNVGEQVRQVSNPGIQQVRRFRSDKEFIGDGIYDETGAPEPFTIVDPVDSTRRKHLPEATNLKICWCRFFGRAN